METLFVVCSTGVIIGAVYVLNMFLEKKHICQSLPVRILIFAPIFILCFIIYTSIAYIDLFKTLFVYLITQVIIFVLHRMGRYIMK